MNNNEINPSLKEKIYQETLDQLAKISHIPSYKDDDVLATTWEDANTELYGIEAEEIEKAVRLAIDKTDAAARADERQRCIEKLYDIDGETEAESLWFMEHVLERIRKKEDARAKFGGSKELPPRDMIWEGINYYKEQAIAKLSKR